MRILAISDEELGNIYNPQIRERFKHIDIAISCGDLPYYYLEYIISMLDINLYYVRGNHARDVEFSIDGQKKSPWGGVDLHRKVVRDESGLILAGVQGSLRYNNGPYQYTQSGMWENVLTLVPKLLLNRIVYGKYLDIFVTHASPWKIHDRTDRPHIGSKAFRWFNRVFQPAIHLHGHIHVYKNDEITETQFQKTRIINAFGYKEIEIETLACDGLSFASRQARHGGDE